MREGQKLLIIGAKDYERKVDDIRVDCVTWDKLAEAENCGDYDTVFLNLLPIQLPKQQEQVDWARFHHLLNIHTATDILLHDGKIIILGDPRFSVPMARGPRPPGINDEPFLRWTGLQFTWNNQSGDTIEFDEYSHGYFKEYVKYFRKWNYSLDKCIANKEVMHKNHDLREFMENDYGIHVDETVACCNRYKNAVIFGVHLLFLHRYQNAVSLGWIWFLPQISLGEDETIQLILRDICDVGANLSEPDWISQYTPPGQQPIDIKIAAIEADLAALSGALETANQERADVRKYLKLLYEREFALEPIVHEVLRQLGAQVEVPVEKNKEDGWIIVDIKGKIFEGVLEIKSTKSDQFGEDGRKQLLDWIDRGRTLRSKRYKGIFIGNSAVTEPVQERPDAFSDSWKKSAELSEICAIKTEYLYTVYVLHKQNKIDLDGFWTALFNTKGIYDNSLFALKE